MGSVTIIFIVPIMLFIMLIGTGVGTITGENETEVELPYNPQEGYVWEYNYDESHYFDLLETEINGDKQTFIFRGKSIKDKFGSEISTEEIVNVTFTAENGSEEFYYACVDQDFLSLYDKIQFYSEEECVYAKYTPKEKTTVEDAEWYVSSYYTNVNIEETDGEKTFTFFYLPDKNGATNETITFYYQVRYDDGRSTKQLENVEVVFKINSDGYEIISENHSLDYDYEYIEQ